MLTAILTAAELAAHLRTSERTIARMVLDGLPSILVGRRRRFDLAAVIRWTEARACQQSNSRQARGTSLSASTASAFIDASRRVHLRVMPGSSRQNLEAPSVNGSQPSLATRD